MHGWRRIAVAATAGGALTGAVIAGCASHDAAPPAGPPVGPPAAPATTTDARGEAMREWEAVAGDHFSESARALEQIADGAGSGDESVVRQGCARLHDTTAIGLQRHLPTPDPELTAQLQQMIDDMNTATHACARFAADRKFTDAAVYQDYLARAMEHLDRAKTVLDRDLGLR